MRNPQKPIWQDPHGWCIDFSVHGRRFRKRLGLRDRSLKGVAEAEAARIYKDAWQRALDPVTAPSAPPFYSAAADYVRAGGSPRFLPPLIEYFGRDTTIDDIDEAAIVAAGVAVYPGRAPDTIRRQVRVPVQAVQNFARGNRRRKSTDRKRLRWLTPEEAERLLQAAMGLKLPNHQTPEPYTAAKIAALLGTGMRTGECFAAMVDDFNEPTRQLWIPAVQTGAGKTSSSARWVRFPTRALEIIGAPPEEGRMFRTAYGKPITMRDSGGGQMKESFDRARDAAGLGPDVTPHVLRHTWATWFYCQTRDFGTLMDQGGWSDAGTANRYRKLAPDDLPERLLRHGWEFRAPSATGQHLRAVK